MISHVWSYIWEGEREIQALNSYYPIPFYRQSAVKERDEQETNVAQPNVGMKADMHGSVDSKPL